MGIPRIIHQIWVGPEKPPKFLGSWKEKHPDWDYIAWNVSTIEEYLPIKNQHLFDDYANSKEFGNLSGLCDILRYEILYDFGGVYIDADIECLRPLEGGFLNSNFFVSYVNERIEKTLSNAVIGCTKNHPIMYNLINELNQYDKVEGTPNIFSGSLKLTKIINESDIDVIKLPAYYFHPVHYSGAEYKGDFKPFGNHRWLTAGRLFKSN